MLDLIIKFDRTLFLIINNGLENRVNDLFLGAMTLLGYSHVLLPVAALYLYLTDKKIFRKNMTTLIIAVIIGAVAVHVTKEIIARPRPLKDLELLAAAGKVHIHTLFYPFRENSFPSGHTQIAFTTATVLAFIKREHAFYFFLTALLVGLSRIYVGVHFPLDVFFGALFGIVSSMGTIKIAALRKNSEKEGLAVNNIQ